jgi:glycine hydroxymethyltransferase
MRKICDMNGAWLLSDMAHISGLVSAGVIPSPFDHSDIVTTTTHKSLRGPRGAMIFFRKGVRSIDSKKGGEKVMYDLENRVNFSVFPGSQGGPHNHTIAALATALKQANTPEFKAYQKQVLKNCVALADTLKTKGYSLVGGGTDNHLVLVDLMKTRDIDVARVERILEIANVATNKNTIPGDVSAMTPGGIRMGTPALTSRGFVEKDFVAVADFFDRAVTIAGKVKKDTGGKVKDFKEALAKGPEKYPELVKLAAEVKAFANKASVLFAFRSLHIFF